MPFFFLYKLFINLISSYKRFQRCLWQMSAASICLLPGTSRLPERFQKLIVVRGPQLLYRLHTWQVDLPSPRCRTRRLIHLSFFKVQWQFHQLGIESTCIFLTTCCFSWLLTRYSSSRHFPAFSLISTTLWWCSPFSSLISPWHGVRMAPMFAHASWSSFNEPEGRNVS